jgi:hypothetical protein
MSRNRGLSPSEHLEVGSDLKRARALLLSAAGVCRCYGKLSRQLGDLADALCEPRSWLEARLIEAVGADAMVEGVHCRDVYFGELGEKEKV